MAWLWFRLSRSTSSWHPCRSPLGRAGDGKKRLHALVSRNICQLAALPVRRLIEHFGKSGRHLWHFAHGKDERSVMPDRETKLASTETTFPRDSDRRELRTWVRDLLNELAASARNWSIRACSACCFSCNFCR